MCVLELAILLHSYFQGAVPSRATVDDKLLATRNFDCDILQGNCLRAGECRQFEKKKLKCLRSYL